MTQFNYSGSELDLFEKAQNWKHYWADSVAKYVKGDVLEVGAGIGANLDLFANNFHSRWLALEPDLNLYNVIKRKFSGDEKYLHYEVVHGALIDIDQSSKFDVVLYIDVLEHIEFDALELEMASERLIIGGAIVILAPAHNYLFSEFDKKIGHFRRYNKKLLRDAIPKSCVVEKLFYLDSAGFFASLANKFFLHSAQPTSAQIIFWDKFLIPLSKLIDLLTFNKFGKTVVCILVKKS